MTNYNPNILMTQKFNPSVISTTKPISVCPKPNYSSVISNTKILEKTKRKSKSRWKSRYIIKVIKIQENIGDGETMLTFEMLLPMHQIRFTCSLNNEIKTLDLSNLIGKGGQMPGELSKKDILESLVNTVKKICLCLRNNINSIPLNEDYIFHPCIPSSGLIKLSDFNFSVQDSVDSDNNPISVPITSSLTINNCNNSCYSYANLSRQPSNKDLSQPISNLPKINGDQHYYNSTENDLILFNESDVLTSTKSDSEKNKGKMKYVCQNKHNLPSIVSTKCTCPENDKTLKIPGYLFTTVKQIMDKLLNIQCKGLIILPQSNDILTRTFRVLEIPANHMFVGLPCSDSSYNMTKGQKDKDFIIAKDTRDPENVTEKCVYQKPLSGAVLLDSLGEIQHIQKPSLIFPSTQRHCNEKIEVRPLPVEITHHNDQSLYCDQILDILKSLIQMQNSMDVQKDELFDSPVFLGSKSEIGNRDKKEVKCYPRQLSYENISSQIQVEHIFCQYIALPKAELNREEINLIRDNYERDLPKQHVRSRKISNDSLDSNYLNVTRTISTVTYNNDFNNIQSQDNIQQLISNNQLKSLPIGTLVNHTSISRITTVPPSVAGQYILTNQNTNNSMYSANIYIQGMPDHTLYNNSIQGSLEKVIMTQSKFNVPVVQSNKNSFGSNFPCILQNQMVLSQGLISQSQISQIHQMTKNPTHRIILPSYMSSATFTSCQPMSNMKLLQHKVLPVLQHVISAQIHPSQMTPFSEQYSLNEVYSIREITEPSFPSLPRQRRLSNDHQLPSGFSHYIDPNVINSIMPDNLRIQLKYQLPRTQLQSQTTPLIFIPTQTILHSNSNNNLTPATEGSFKVYPLSTNTSTGGNQHINVPMSEVIDYKQKIEQKTLGRFAVKPIVTDFLETS